MDVKLRLMTIEDIPEGMRLKDLAGWNQTAADWERFISSNPEGCFSAECEGSVIGTATSIVYEGRFAWIGMVMVEQRHRSRGIGTALLNRAIMHLDSRNVPCIKLDATPQGKILYEKLGFVPEHEVERWMLRRESNLFASGKSHAEIGDVLSLDRAVFGADRNELLRSLAETAPDLTLVSRRDTDIEGYAFGRRGSLADQLGPWMARNEKAAAALLDEFVCRSGRDLLFVDCLRQNPWATPLVKARGFEFSRPLTRMFRGRNEYPGQPELLCAILGPEFG